ncbi:xylose isomerase [Rugosimonospora africana]|uniref:Xylose isomerase n=1 Tax=Rugosimonospora africana TaxID=556532 RepID=A0A8J3VSZ8_9ACTN|nr:xylose isomerase [Rugosimonospora africana]
MIGLDRLALNQATTDRWSVAEAVDGCQRAGIGAIGLWRRQVGEAGLAESVAAVRRAGLHVSSLCRGGFFTAVDPDARAAAMADNRRAIDEAAALEADVLVLVSGGLAGSGKNLPAARSLVADALDELAPYAQKSGVRLGIEPLHPMFCADRCVVSTLGQALDLALPYPSATVGVVVDTYHVWWDPDLDAQLARAGDRIASFQVCDWVVPLPADMLLGRGHVGDGHIDFRRIAAPVEAAGYRGWVEVEIFNEKIWATPGDETLRTMKDTFARELG